MDDNDETHLHIMYASHVDMDATFRVRMLAAIIAGLENGPIGVLDAYQQSLGRFLSP
jgi:hypothetical protein